MKTVSSGTLPAKGFNSWNRLALSEWAMAIETLSWSDGAFVDPAGGSGPDAMTLAIAHKARPDDRIIIDAVREMRPPFSPTVVVDEFAELLQGLRRYQSDW